MRMLERIPSRKNKKGGGGRERERERFLLNTSTVTIFGTIGALILLCTSLFPCGC